MRSDIRWLRFGFPLLIALAGIVVAVLWSAVVGAALVAAAIAVFVANLYMRLAISSQGDRDRESRARQTFERTGRWPDDPA